MESNVLDDEDEQRNDNRYGENKPKLPEEGLEGAKSLVRLVAGCVDGWIVERAHRWKRTPSEVEVLYGVEPKSEVLLPVGTSRCT
jgi:hypothetical protein